MSAPLLSVTGLSAASRRGGGERILRDVSFAMDAGQVHGLVGESGAGKSTIAKAILGILPAGVGIDGGRILFRGRDLLTVPRREFRALLGEEIALIPQDPLTALNPGRRIAAQLTDGLRQKRGLSRRQAEERALALLDEVHIRDPERVMRVYPHELSGGMRQRVLIAAAFALDPKLVIADEPTTALDVTVQKQILRLIRSMQERHGTGIVFVTHDLGVVAQICDHVTVLYMGKVIEQRPTADLLRDPRADYTRALIDANPRYDRPGADFHPIPPALIASLRAGILAGDGPNREARA